MNNPATVIALVNIEIVTFLDDADLIIYNILIAFFKKG